MGWPEDLGRPSESWWDMVMHGHDFVIHTGAFAARKVTNPTDYAGTLPMKRPICPSSSAKTGRLSLGRSAASMMRRNSRLESCRAIWPRCLTA